MIRSSLDRFRRLARVALDPDGRKAFFIEERAWLARRRGHASIPLEGRRTYFENPHHLAVLYRDIFLDRIYDFETRDEQPVIIDCGANIGLGTIRFKHRHPRARVFAFEPDPHFAAILEKNIESWGLVDVQVIQSAVWSSAGTLAFQPDDGLGGHLSAPGENGGIEVPAVRLRDYLSGPVDFLKIDIEGAELDVLKDCKDALGNVRRLFVEWHSYAARRQTLDELLEILRAAGYRYWIQKIESPRLPFLDAPAADGKLDMCVNICAAR